MALALARSLADCGTYRVDAAASAYVGWYLSRPFDIGTATRRGLGAAAAALERGQNPAEAAREAADPHTQANGRPHARVPLSVSSVGGTRGH